jgi:metal-responsive CopG/Arc/MetJ family transcriptional regulator
MTIIIGNNLSKEITRLARKKGVSRGEYARDALKRYLGVIRFRELQAKTTRFLEARGIRVDDVAL